MTMVPNGGNRGYDDPEGLRADDSKQGDDVERSGGDLEVALEDRRDEVPAEVDAADWLDSAVEPEPDTEDRR